MRNSTVCGRWNVTAPPREPFRAWRGDCGHRKSSMSKIYEALMKSSSELAGQELAQMFETSAGPHEGKTVTSINLAGALALKSGAMVVLIDGDLRRSSVHETLGLPRSPGISNVLAGEATLTEALVQAAELPNLYILTAGDSK